MYKKEIKKQGEIFFKEKLKKYFPNNDILYIVQKKYVLISA